MFHQFGAESSNAVRIVRGIGRASLVNELLRIARSEHSQRFNPRNRSSALLGHLTQMYTAAIPLPLQVLGLTVKLDAIRVLDFPKAQIFLEALAI